MADPDAHADSGSGTAVGDADAVPEGLGDLNTYAWDRLNRSNAAEIRGLAERALHRAERDGTHLERIAALRTLAGADNLGFAYEAAAERLEEAFALLQPGEAAPLRLDLLVLSARVHYSRGDYARVVAHALDAQRLAERLGRPLDAAVALNVLGHAYRVLGLSTDAIQAYEASMARFEAAGDWRRSHPRSGLARVDEQLGQGGRALDHYRRSLEVREAAGYAYDASIARACVGACLLSLGDPRAAKPYVEQALAEFERWGDRVNAAATRVRLGDVHRALGAFEAAQLDYAEVSDTAERLPPGQRAEAHLGASRAERAAGRPSAAAERARAALRGLDGLGVRPQEAEAHRLLVDLNRDAGHYREALDHFDRYVDLREALADRDARTARETMEIRLDMARIRHERSELERQNQAFETAYANLQELHAQAERASEEDPLTGLANRRHFTRRVREEVHRALRYGRDLSLAIVDVDDFKAVNDHHSHGVGDKVLQQLATLMRAAMRENDLVARHGGEEFVVLLPDTDLAAAHRAADKLRRAVAEADWSPIVPGLTLTVSVGVTTATDGAPPSELLERADRALYRAKDAGKNVVRLADDATKA